MHFISSLINAFTRFPSLASWFETLCYAFLFGLVSYFLAPDSDFIDAASTPSLYELVLVGAVAFFIPCLFEEIFFRGILLPRFSIRWVIFSIFCFVAWHPLQVLLYLPEAGSVFLDTRFLLLVAMLGCLCTLLRYRTQSLWPSISLHWIVVIVWKALGGARFIF